MLTAEFCITDDEVTLLRAPACPMWSLTPMMGADVTMTRPRCQLSPGREGGCYVGGILFTAAMEFECPLSQQFLPDSEWKNLILLHQPISSRLDQSEASIQVT